MSLFGMITTSASGMAAQANRLSTVSDNIANVDTVGYKDATTDFSTLLLASSALSDYESGSVKTHVAYGIAQQGQLQYTTSSTDLALQGNGFFVVGGSGGQTYLTRAGSFVQDNTGHLVNTAGYQLMGYSLANGTTPSITANGTFGMQPVDVGNLALQATPSTSGQLYMNLNSNAAVVAAADLPSTNAATATYTSKTSLVTYDNLGNTVNLDIYASKTTANTWEVAAYNQADATSGGFPYASSALAVQTLTFDPSNGQLASSSPNSMSIPIPGGQTLNLDMSQTSQLASTFAVETGSANGNAPSSVSSVNIATDGTLSVVYANGTKVPTYKIALVNVASPDNLTSLAGNVYTPSNDSGNIEVGFAGQEGLGNIVSGALEQSTVDIATELTTMIDASKNYTANSKVFQTGTEMMDVLNNLVR
jgi:flagellar hook protein FlgE